VCRPLDVGVVTYANRRHTSPAHGIRGTGSYLFISLPRIAQGGPRHELIPQLAELVAWQWFGKHIGELLLGGDVFDGNGSLHDERTEMKCKRTDKCFVRGRVRWFVAISMQLLLSVKVRQTTLGVG
jgi:hypothetical protein